MLLSTLSIVNETARMVNGRRYDNLLSPIVDLAQRNPSHPLFAVYPHLIAAAQGVIRTLATTRKRTVAGLAERFIDPDEIGFCGVEETFQDPDVGKTSYAPSHSYTDYRLRSGPYVMRAPFNVDCATLKMRGVAPRVAWRKEARFDLTKASAAFKEWVKALADRSGIYRGIGDYDALYAVRWGVIDYDRRLHLRRCSFRLDVERRLDGEKTLVVAMPECAPEEKEDAGLYYEGCRLGVMHAVGRINERSTVCDVWDDLQLRRYAALVEHESVVIPRVDPGEAEAAIKAFCLRWIDCAVRVAKDEDGAATREETDEDDD